MQMGVHTYNKQGLVLRNTIKLALASFESGIIFCNSLRQLFRLTARMTLHRTMKGSESFAQ